MNREIIHTPNAPAPVGPYNQAIAATGKMLFVAGQIPLNADTGETVGIGDVSVQTQQVMENIKAILEASGANFDHVVKTSVFLANMNDFAAVNTVYAKYFNEKTAPARACVEVSRLPKDVLVEVECIAVI